MERFRVCYIYAQTGAKCPKITRISPQTQKKQNNVLTLNNLQSSTHDLLGLCYPPCLCYRLSSLYLQSTAAVEPGETQRGTKGTTGTT
jgi:hypothetical protein